MAYKTCPDCGERVYNLGCTWCNEIAYIEEQDRLTDLYYPEGKAAKDSAAHGTEQRLVDGRVEN